MMEEIKVARPYPSSQIWHVCGHGDGKKTLNIREWICPICNTQHAKDINASKNILANKSNYFQRKRFSLQKLKALSWRGSLFHYFNRNYSEGK